VKQVSPSFYDIGAQWKKVSRAVVLIAIGFSGSLGHAQTAATEPAAEPAAKPGVTYKGVNLQLGGFIASETVYRQNNMAADIGTPYTKLPFQNSAAYGISEFRGTERQSRFSLLAQGEVDNDTQLAAYYELDFLGTAPGGNANQSNSYTPRTRHIYTTVDWNDMGLHLLAGQTWSLATLNNKGITPRNEMIPLTIDSQYAVGFNWERQWQMRIVKDFDKTFWLGLSFENAQTLTAGGVAPAGTTNTYFIPGTGQMTNNMSFNGYPDIIAKFAAETGFGHYEVYGIARDFQSRYGATAASQFQKQNKWAEGVGAGLIVPAWPKVIDVAVTGLFGKGMGRYGTSQMADVTFGDQGQLDPIKSTQYLAQVMWHATPTLEVYAAYGQEKLDDDKGAAFGYGDGLVASNAGCLALGGACAPMIKSVTQSNIGLWWSFYKGSYGAAKLGAQYSHTNLDTFADAGQYAPTTKQDMIFTSLRYYPF